MQINPYLLLLVLAAFIVATTVLGLRLFMKGLRSRREVAAVARRANPTAAEYYVRTLRQAAEIVDGEANLAAALDVSPEALGRWLEGRESPPIEVQLAALELVTRGAPQEKAE